MDQGEGEAKSGHRALLDFQKTPLYFVPEGVKINKSRYLDMLKSDVLPWLQYAYGNGPYASQQEVAPAHTVNFCSDLGQNRDFRVLGHKRYGLPQALTSIQWTLQYVPILRPRPAKSTIVL